MPGSVTAVLTVALGGSYSPELVPANYQFTLNDGTSVPILIPYGAEPPITANFVDVPEGTWQGQARMLLADGTPIGPTASGQVVVPPPDVELVQPVTLALSVA